MCLLSQNTFLNKTFASLRFPGEYPDEKLISNLGAPDKIHQSHSLTLCICHIPLHLLPNAALSQKKFLLKTPGIPWRQSTLDVPKHTTLYYSVAQLIRGKLLIIMNAPSKAFSVWSPHRIACFSGCGTAWLLSDEDEKPADAHFQRKSSAEKCTPKLPDEASRLGGWGFWLVFSRGWKSNFSASSKAASRQAATSQPTAMCENF